MKSVKRRIFTSVLACLMACIMFSMPVLAASSNFSKTIRLTTNNKTSFSLGSFAGKDTQITQVKIGITMASGMDGFFPVYLESPSGTVIKLMPKSNSIIYYITSFNGENPKGT